VEIPPPPPPSPEDVPPPGSYPGMPPSAPGSSPYDGLPPYPQAPYGQQGPYGQQPPYGGQPPYGPAAPGPGPYGAPHPGQNPYGPQPYGGYPQGGWYAPQLTTNGMAIASLVTAFSCIPLLGVILGIVSLRQIGRNHQKGKGLAIAGVTLSGLGTVLLALIITLGVLGAFDEGNTRVENIRPGQCFNTVGNSLSDYGGGEGARSTTVDVVGCEKSHDAEAFAVFALDADSGGEYPGVDRISAIAETKCAAYASDYTGDTPLPGSMDIYYYMPPPDGWSRGDHSVTCFFGGTQGKVTGSVKDGDKGSGVGV
jgi:hypothetical protein